MIAIKAHVEACGHATYPDGFHAQAHVFVRTDDWSQADELAGRRLTDFGWKTLSFSGSVKLPENADTTGMSAISAEAFLQASEFGIAHVAYPKSAT